MEHRAHMEQVCGSAEEVLDAAEAIATKETKGTQGSGHCEVPKGCSMLPSPI